VEQALIDSEYYVRTTSDTIETREEILDACRALGFNDNKSFDEYYARVIKEGVSQTDLELLDPANVNLTEFWKVCEELHFGAICGAVSKAEQHAPIDQCNFYNWILSVHANVLGNADIVAQKIRNANLGDFNVLEIGVGYNVLKRGVEANPNAKHIGIDVSNYNGLNDAILYDGWNIPQEVMENKDILCVVSCNVFQHLSINQRRALYAQVAKLLKGNKFNSGTFDVTSQICDYWVEPDKRFVKYNENYYICTFGQFTQLQTTLEIQKDLADAGFNITSINYRMDGLVSYSCHIAGPAPEQPAVADTQEKEKEV